MERRGTSILPLHYGHPPEYLFKRMIELGGTLSEIIINEYGVETFLEKLSDPFWFHSFSLVIGFDWNSSGTTTATLAALKEYYEKHSGEIAIMGGKGQKMSMVRGEAEKLIKDGYMSDTKVHPILENARKVAKIDNNLLQDGYDLYLQFIITTPSGKWSVIQQGMDQKLRMARRYHWIWSAARDMYNDSRSGISSSDIRPMTLDLSTKKSAGNRNSMVEVAGEKPGETRSKLMVGGQRTLDSFGNFFPELRMDYTINWARLQAIYEYDPKDFNELMNLKGVGKSTIRALSYLAEIIYGNSPSFEDPVKFSFALGGKDGVPKPVNVHDYDVAISFYRDALGKAGSGDPNTRRLIRNLSEMSYSFTGRQQ
ncbi:MAG: DUF763 domain-containing protein [Thermoplasmataceae archaeon]